MTIVTQIPITIKPLPAGAPNCCCGGGTCLPYQISLQGKYNNFDGPLRVFTLRGDGLYKQIPYDEHCTDWTWGARPSGDPMTEPSLSVVVTPHADYDKWKVELSGGHDCEYPGLGKINYAVGTCATVYPWTLGNSLTIDQWATWPTHCTDGNCWITENIEYDEPLAVSGGPFYWQLIMCIFKAVQS